MRELGEILSICDDVKQELLIANVRFHMELPNLTRHRLGWTIPSDDFSSGWVEYLQSLFTCYEETL